MYTEHALIIHQFEASMASVRLAVIDERSSLYISSILL